MIWNETIECMDREEMRKLQSLRLKRVVEHAYHNSPFYRKKMQEMGIAPDDIQTIDDITKLPITVKQDLRDNYPFGLMAVPMSEIVRLHVKHKQPTKAIVTALLKDGRAHVRGLYSEKTGKTYDATVVLADDGQYANFKLEFDQQKGGKR